MACFVHEGLCGEWGQGEGTSVDVIHSPRLSVGAGCGRLSLCALLFLAWFDCLNAFIRGRNRPLILSVFRCAVLMEASQIWFRVCLVLHACVFFTFTLQLVRQAALNGLKSLELFVNSTHSHFTEWCMNVCYCPPFVYLLAIVIITTCSFVLLPRDTEAN